MKTRIFIDSILRRNLRIFKIRSLYIVMLLFCLACEVFAQSPLEKIKFTRIAAALSNPRVSCILQDSQGFLWVGTEDGLNKFDGYEVTVYRNDPNDTTSLLKNVILKMFEDSRGVLWVSTSSGGLHMYNREQDNFRRLPRYSFDCEVTEFHQDDSSVWVAGIYHHNAFADQINKKTGRSRNYILFDSRHPVHTLVPASDHEFWVGIRDTGFFRWDPRKKDIRQIFSSKLNRAIKGGDHTLWIASHEGLQKYNTLTNEIIAYNTHTTPALPVDNVLNVSLEGKYLWVGTENGGLCRLNTITNELLTFQSIKNDPKSLPDNSIHAICKDRQGRIWIGTYSNGIAFTDRLGEKFKEVDIPLENDVVNAIVLDSKNRLWVGTEDGLIMKSAHGIKHYKHTAAKESLQANPVLAIYEDKQQRIWVGTWGGGLNRYDEAHDRFIHYMPDEKRKGSLSNPNVFAIRQSTTTQQLLVATYNGLNVLTDERAGTFEHVRESQFEVNNYIHTIYEDKKGNLWAGSLEELLRYDPIQKKLTRFETATHPDSIQVGGLCNSILEDSRGRLWVGTRKGLHLLIDGKFKKRYTTQDGLPNNIVQGILEDDAGNLWLSTAKGISRFNPDKGVFRNYDIADGLPGNDFKSNAYARNKNGQFFFGGKGICVFNPDSVRDNPFVPGVFITELRILNEPVKSGDHGGLLKNQISETKVITLPPQYNFFALKYVAINFTATDKNRYAYKLEGFHKDWNYVGDQRSVMFTNLDPGMYTFKVKACNNDGLWNEQGAQLVIYVLPPWWRTWWAKLAGILLLAGAAICIYTLRVRNIQRRNKMLEMQVQKRTEELAQQNEELIQSQEEISAQRDVVSAQNLELQKARQIIEDQNNVIVMRNETLETEVKERTRDLVEYNQQLEQFAFISAHNLRAPVARILGLGHILEIANSDLNEARSIIDKIVFTTQELDRVVKDLNTVLDLRRNSTSVIAPVNLEEELRLIKINLEKEIQDTHTIFIEDFSKGDTLWGVKPYIDSIFMNLISNAIKYRHPRRNPVITIRSEVHDDQLYINIQDNGLGIDLNLYKEKLFMLYSRFHLHVEGKGMGLFLVKTQVSAMGGKIDVTSNLNEGTCFRLAFKLAHAV
ncbi:MAG TPA: two-component regulator propeller domain-containing protein [Ohtaekwangia sp.]|uniref:two-component regulator propeller domain-containing protein n=1 Tax=Ohtaekwangia sp. TaxID=2066019 RepID=UPI002F9512D9